MSAVELGYARRHRRPAWNYRRMLRRAAVALAVMAVLGTLILGRYSTVEVCRATARVRLDKGWVIPGTDLRIWASVSEEPTPLAEALARLGAGGSQRDWTTAVPRRSVEQKLGLMTSCFFGDGMWIRRECYSARVAGFIEAVSLYLGKDTAGTWLDYIMSGKSRGCLDGMLEIVGCPATGFASRIEFDDWWREHGEYLDSCIGR